MKVPMATTNLFYAAGVQRGRLHQQRRRRARLALQKTMRSIDLGVELGATTYVFWGGREGLETNACKDPRRRGQALPRGAELSLRVRAIDNNTT